MRIFRGHEASSSDTFIQLLATSSLVTGSNPDEQLFSATEKPRYSLPCSRSQDEPARGSDQGVLALPEANGTDDMCDAAVEAGLKPWLSTSWTMP
jgi:hypothetical protein